MVSTQVDGFNLNLTPLYPMPAQQVLNFKKVTHPGIYVALISFTGYNGHLSHLMENPNTSSMCVLIDPFKSHNINQHHFHDAFWHPEAQTLCSIAQYSPTGEPNSVTAQHDHAACVSLFFLNVLCIFCGFMLGLG